MACGGGQFTEVLKDNLKSFDYITGMDVAEDALCMAREKFLDERFNFIHGSAQEIPFNEGLFDTVCISKGLHHMEDARSCLKEMCRVLKRGGLLIINEMYSDHLSTEQQSHLLYHHLRVDIDTLLGISHRYTFKKDEILVFAEELRLRDVSVHEYLEEEGDPTEPETIEEYGSKMDDWIPLIKDLKDRDEILKRMSELKIRFRKTGIARPTQLVIFGYK